MARITKISTNNTEYTLGIQTSTMPTASADELGKIYQYIGTTDSNFTQGYTYKCKNGSASGTYIWDVISTSFVTWSGTQAEYNAAVQADKIQPGTIVTITDASPSPSGGGGHTIINSSGTSMTQRAGLQFSGATVTDDSTNDKTIVDLSGKMATDGSNAASSVKFSGKLTVGSRASGSTEGTNSFASGYSNTASGNYSHAEGQYAKATSYYSHAEGNDTTASNQCSHAEGNTTTASGECSHAEGYSTTASGDYSHTEGTGTVASASRTHAEGFYTTAGYQYQHVSGKYNNNKSDTLLEVGNGTSSSAKSNALEVYSNGDLNITGDYKRNGSLLSDPLTSVYNPATTYYPGDYFIHNNILYKVRTDNNIVSVVNQTPPNATYYTATTIGAELNSLNSGLSNQKAQFTIPSSKSQYFEMFKANNIIKTGNVVSFYVYVSFTQNVNVSITESSGAFLEIPVGYRPSSKYDVLIGSETNPRHNIWIIGQAYDGSSWSYRAFYITNTGVVTGAVTSGNDVTVKLAQISGSYLTD